MRNTIRNSIASAVLVAASSLAADPSLAAGSAPRVWVSGHGTDVAGCGAPANPCRSFQYVHDNVVKPGGEIDVLDPAGYGALTIAMALSIVNDGVGTAGVQASAGNAITISAGAGDAVHLRGLNIDGLGTAANGLLFNTGGSLTVVDCVIRHFFGSFKSSNGNAIYLAPTTSSTYLISNSILADNTNFGLFFSLNTGGINSRIIIDRVTSTNNSTGMEFAFQNSGGSATNIAVSNSAASNNGVGISFSGNSGGGSMNSTVDGIYAENNNTTGISVLYATILLSKSTVSLNPTGINIGTGGTVYTMHDNRISLNFTSDVTGSLDTTLPQK